MRSATTFAVRVVVALIGWCLAGNSARAQVDAAPARSSGGCPATLGHLSQVLPTYEDPQLIELRNMILATDLRQSMQTAEEMGYTPAAAAKASLEQAKAFDKTLASAETCIRQAATAPDAVIQLLQRGQFDFRSQTGITTECARAYVGAYYAAVANRESAVGLACLAGQQ